jgi:hypothetical protein
MRLGAAHDFSIDFDLPIANTMIASITTANRPISNTFRKSQSPP